ncbi:MAG: hypothetical protein LBT19_01585 [Candidatus Nomurabacteria bacterium]|jgi:hypothetical protein|nr:hypothetical protein [Candidatus Nomurabacteria bacterium]
MKISRILSVALALILVTTLAPSTVFASNSNYYTTTYRNLDHAWQNSTDMVDVSFDDWEKNWAEWLCDTSKRNPSFTDIVSATYDATVSYAEFNHGVYDKKVTYNNRTVQIKNLPKGETLSYLPQYTFSECLYQVTYYVGDNYRGRSQPEWTESDYARFMVGLLRAQDIPAYIIVGTQGSLDRYTYRVAVIDSANQRIYYCDPARGAMSGNISKWRWLTLDEYNDDFKYSHIYNENIANGEILPVDRVYTTTAVNIPANKRFEGINVPIRKGGRTTNVYMRVVMYNGDAYFWIRDVAKMLKGTSGEIWVDHDGTLLFGKGNYEPNGTEINWADGKSIPIDTLSQAYVLSHAYYGGERIKMSIVQIGNDLYVRPDDITGALGINGLNINVNIK